LYKSFKDGNSHEKGRVNTLLCEFGFNYQLIGTGIHPAPSIAFMDICKNARAKRLFPSPLTLTLSPRGEGTNFPSLACPSMAGWEGIKGRVK
jgi:hypothetical protein